jgi:hypothetical protein
MPQTDCLVKSLNRTSRGEQGTLFRVPNPGSEFDPAFTTEEAREVTLEFCRNETAAYRALQLKCVAPPPSSRP